MRPVTVRSPTVIVVMITVALLSCLALHCDVSCDLIKIQKCCQFHGSVCSQLVVPMLLLSHVFKSSLADSHLRAVARLANFHI